MPQSPTPTSEPSLEQRIQAIGTQLARALDRLVRALPGPPRGPQQLVTLLGVDKAFASRLMKSLRHSDPMAALHHVPGPEPLRKLIRAARKVGLESSIAKDAERAVEDFATLLRDEVGDRSALRTILSAWLPAARAEFEVRSKQAAYRAMSQLKGASTETNVATVLLHPAVDGASIDVVWIVGQLGLQRLRPGVSVKFATRRMVPDDAERRPTTLDGTPIENFERSRLDAFCTAPAAPLVAERIRDVVHYTLADNGFGPHSAVDLLFAEVNLAEMPLTVEAGSGRKGYVFAEVPVPAKMLVLDVFAHQDVYPGRDAELLVYDTAVEGVADVNNPTRDVDRFDLVEEVKLLGRGLGRARTTGMPNYVDLLEHAFGELGWDPGDFRGYRCQIDYPIYGSQVVLAFDPPEADA